MLTANVDINHRQHRPSSTERIILTRNGALDVLKIVMALMVVGLHAGFLANFSAVGSYLLVNGLFRIAVPTFLLINGYFFYQSISRGLATQWFKRVIQLYAFWMLIYSPYWLPDLTQGYPVFIAGLIRYIFLGYFHLWYLAGMIGAAIITMILARSGTRLLVISSIFAVSLGIAIQYADGYGLINSGFLRELAHFKTSHRNFLLFSFPFFCIGFLINKHQLQRHLTFKSALITTVVAIALLLIESYSNFARLGSNDPFDNLIALVLACPAIFVLFIKTNIQTDSKNLALYSTGIYLSHILIMSFISNIIKTTPTTLAIVTAALAALATSALIKMNKKFSFIL